jgi:hypothetical protein
MAATDTVEVSETLNAPIAYLVAPIDTVLVLEITAAAARIALADTASALVSTIAKFANAYRVAATVRVLVALILICALRIAPAVTDTLEVADIATEGSNVPLE